MPRPPRARARGAPSAWPTALRRGTVASDPGPSRRPRPPVSSPQRTCTLLDDAFEETLSLAAWVLLAIRLGGVHPRGGSLLCPAHGGSAVEVRVLGPLEVIGTEGRIDVS